MRAFPFRSWERKIPCSAECGRHIRHGYVAANAPVQPDHALCAGCYADLMDDPQAFVTEQQARGHNIGLLPG